MCHARFQIHYFTLEKAPGERTSVFAEWRDIKHCLFRSWIEIHFESCGTISARTAAAPTAVIDILPFQLGLDTSTALNTPIRRKRRRQNPPLNNKGDLSWGKNKKGNIRKYAQVFIRYAGKKKREKMWGENKKNR
jgi:hypothetical protein